MLMTQVTAAIVSPKSITLVIDGHTTPITDSHPNYAEIRAAASAGKYALIDGLLDLVKAVVDFGAGRVSVEDGVVLFDGKATHNAVTSRILAMVDEGLEVGPMLRFLDNLMENPSYRSVQQLYTFLEVNDLPITEDGCFLAYKMVDRNSDGTLTDHRTKTFDYSIGAAPAKMPRNQVNEDPTQTCSSGLHVCAQGYLGHYYGGGATILVKVNPRDVVAVPTDYQNAKMRVCEHVTVREVDPKTRGFAFTSAVYKPGAVEANTLVSASGGDVVTRDEAIVRLGLQGAADPKGALRKRLSRGTTAKEVFVAGESMVQIIDPADANKEVVDDSVVTHENAMQTLGIDKSALRKRLNRGSTVKRVYVNGTEMVKFVEQD